MLVEVIALQRACYKLPDQHIWRQVMSTLRQTLVPTRLIDARTWSFGKCKDRVLTATPKLLPMSQLIDILVGSLVLSQR